MGSEIQCIWKGKVNENSHVEQSAPRSEAHISQIPWSSGVSSRDISYLLIRSSPACQILLTLPEESHPPRKQNTSEDPTPEDRKLFPLFLRRAGSTHSQPQLFGTLNPNLYRYLFCKAQPSESSAGSAATLTALIPAASVCTPRLQRKLGSPGPLTMHCKIARISAPSPSSDSSLIDPAPTSTTRAWGTLSGGAEPEGSPTKQGHPLSPAEQGLCPRHAATHRSLPLVCVWCAFPRPQQQHLPLSPPGKSCWKNVH